MSKRHDVIAALRALAAIALPNADVMVLDDEDPAPTRLAPGGRVVIRSGDPGDPEVTLGLLTYHYSHRIPIELTAYPTSADSRGKVLDEMAAAIGDAIEADRTLGGLAEWIEPEPLITDDIFITAAQAAGKGETAVIADYSTSNPLN
ncbi:hypothetical protein [Sphingobium scionense]|uniref:Acyl-CoA transferase n=1 Tax=Sphingobium scionense TaxID=1404341 RepID=A0A7W6PWF0_9SPHN|nr:hypothetical protein [Sphingobium scionense]MBB4149129.1 hypothetical protein [Sphingobium scionense]